MVDSHFKYLAHFFGPKGENEDFVNKLVSLIMVDYAHWRRNYFPDDPYMMTPALQRELENETETITKETHALLAGLRRSFPFYSPRYVAHQQSETTIASTIGAIAGTLYNSNNVTPESGIATVEWEIDACNALLRMLGYEPAPDPPPNAQGYDDYTRRLQSEFGWCHLTSGGTIANIEALWVARTIKYFPLAVRDACIAHKLPLKIKLPSGRLVDISSEEAAPHQIIGVKPNESIFLLGRFVSKVAKEKGWPIEEASRQAWEMLNESAYSPANGMGSAFHDFPPTIFVSGAAHYSVTKAADLLGIGRNAVRIVPMDSTFRMDVRHLEADINDALSEGRCILAVISIAGTTEEGAVDPLHEILSVRSNLEASRDQSFWVHVDAAWGGYIRSVFVDRHFPSDKKVTYNLLKKRLFSLTNERFQAEPFFLTLEPDPEHDPRGWVKELLIQLGARGDPTGLSNLQDIVAYHQQAIDEAFDEASVSGNYRRVLTCIYMATKDLGANLEKSAFNPTLMDRVADTREFARGTVELKLSSYSKTLDVQWPHDDAVGMAFFSLKEADSITVDPHKMGYTVYPNGAIAFKNDRVRHFIRQEAPYITSRNTNALVHLPIRHAEKPDSEFSDTRTTTQAFAPFTLEGTRPSAAACSLWLSSRTLPFDRRHHGTIVRSSLLAARAFHEWIMHWEKIANTIGEDTRYELISYSNNPPDTNIVVFGVKDKNSTSIEAFNKLNLQVYSRFSIQSELGRREYSYSQPFFLSKTEFNSKSYGFKTLQSFLEKNDFRNAKENYDKHGLVVLRATIMNPYILPTQALTDCDLIREFFRELHTEIQQILKKPGDF